MASVRQAVAADFQTLVVMGNDMQRESPRFKRLGYNHVKVLNLFKQLTDSENGLVLVAETEGIAVGMLLGFVTPQFFSDTLTASELVVYVTPEARGGTTVVKMIRAFEGWAYERGAVEICLGVSTELDASRTAALYERLGYDRSGVTLIKRCA